VIVGGPKCGTTALFATLRQHPQLGLSKIKEPRYFASDYPGRREMETDAEYQALFAHAGHGQLRGEASAIYLTSEVAIPAILERRPDAKLIALVRNPVDMFVSWHNECLKSLDEDEKDPERAWCLQEMRAGGSLPELCWEPGYLQYRKICSLGTQIGRLFDLVPASQRLVIVWDDLQTAPAAVIKQVVDFLGIEDIGITEFARENVYASHKSQAVARLVRSFYAYPRLKILRRRVKPALNACGIFPLLWAVKLSLRKSVKPRLSEDFHRELTEEFDREVRLLEQLLDRDLSSWRTRLMPAYQSRAR
jgi:hypothetical protein